jgi:hypothetical protein
MASGTAVERSTGGDLPAGQDASDADAVQRYKAEDLGAFVAVGTQINHALYEGPDGQWHAEGDVIGDNSRRDKTGRLRDATGYVQDNNKLPAKDIAQAEPGQPFDKMPVPSDADQLAQLEALRNATLDRAQKVDAKNEVWDSQVEPLADLLREAGLPVDRSTFGSEKFMVLLEDVMPDLPRTVQVAATAAATDYEEASRGLVEASETLGIAGGKFAMSLLHPNGQTITSSDGTRGSPSTLDRTVYDKIDAPTLIIVEEKGAGSSLGVRLVADRNSPGTSIKAQQCSPEYVHDLLEKDAILAAALRSDPQLCQNVQSAIKGSNGGDVECLLVHTSAEGVVKVVPYILDAQRFQRETIQVPLGEGATH